MCLGPQKSALSSDDDAMSRQIGCAIGDARKLTGQTLDAVAEKVGVTYQRLQLYERGDARISVVRFAQIARALDIQPAQLLIAALDGKVSH